MNNATQTETTGTRFIAVTYKSSPRARKVHTVVRCRQAHEHQAVSTETTLTVIRRYEPQAVVVSIRDLTAEETARHEGRVQDAYEEAMGRS